jgi:hypothetical protein
LIVRVVEPAGVEHARVLFPEQLAVQVVTIETFRAEQRDDMFAVNCGSGGGVRRLRMAFNFGHAFVSRALPENFARLLVEAIDFPGML